ncbi:twin-arginine translocase subunit TatC [Tabrizicola piscis]|uniref:Sec-independent protein translocase protein TatC n=1 Tax=Tabrizicola piscis TaxID=2494374 RepID=A0A3S8U309_9RHOB|nr:twin-arginine translocase subunit TatC [Tabrizicola piscis]AZL57955.1 twin-arginine translocase subunit TatC [Tabrizicola piscis]
MTTKDDIEDSSAPLVEHLAELRNRLIWSVSAFLIAMILCFVVAEPILDFLLAPIEEAMRSLGDPNPVMQYTAPQEYFFTLVQISVVAGLMVSFPVIAYQLWRFVAPGLYRSEKQAFLPFLLASPILFFVGAAFAHYVVTPIAMTFFLGFADAYSVIAALVPSLTDAPVIDPAAPVVDQGIDIVFQGKVNETLDISLKLILAFGLCFQLPVLLTLMGKAGIATSAGLAGMRRYAIVIILIVAALVTPPDVMSQLILFFAVYPLYEVSIFLIRRIEKRREAEAKADGTWVEPEADE